MAARSMWVASHLLRPGRVGLAGGRTDAFDALREADLWLPAGAHPERGGVGHGVVDGAVDGALDGDGFDPGAERVIGHVEHLVGE